MADGSPASATYRPRAPSGTALQRLVARTLPTLEGAVDALDAGASLPRFVRDALDGYAGCGDYARGMARLRCGPCRLDRFVAFTCKRRVVCASCGGRRMTDLAAHLVDEVVPVVPVRQWVLTVPFPLRYRLATNGALASAVRRALMDALRDHLVGRFASAATGTTGPLDAKALAALARHLGRVRFAAVSVAQRFGSGLNLHLHYHLLVADGVFVGEGADLRFRDVGLFTVEDVGAVLRATVEALLARGVFDALGEAVDADELSATQQLALASVAHRIGTGPRRGQRVERVGARIAREAAKGEVHLDRARTKATFAGFDLEAATRVARDDRRALERLARYVLRPALGEPRLAFDAPDGKVTLKLKSPWPDGTTHLRFTPLELVEKLAALVPRPHENLLTYHGAFAANARGRVDVVRLGRVDTGAPALPPTKRTSDLPLPARMRRDFATLMRRGLGIDVLVCPTCGGRMRLLALIEDARVARRIAEHLGLVRTNTGPPASPRDEQAAYVETHVVYDELPPEDRMLAAYFNDEP